MQTTDMYPPFIASQMLEQANGIQRNAEVKAWELAERYGPDTSERRAWVEVIKCIVFGGDDPKVPRRDPNTRAAA